MDRKRSTLKLMDAGVSEPVAPRHDHVVQFYGESEALIQAAGAFLAGGLLSGGPAIVIAEGSRLPLFRRQLGSMGIDVEGALRIGRLCLLDSASMLASFMVEGLPDERLFRKEVGSLIASTSEIWRPSRLHAFGDMVDLLWGQENAAGAVALEALWNDLAHRHGFALHCAYAAAHFQRDEDRAAFDSVCAQHGRIVALDAESAQA